MNDATGLIVLELSLSYMGAARGFIFSKFEPAFSPVSSRGFGREGVDVSGGDGGLPDFPTSEKRGSRASTSVARANASLQLSCNPLDDSGARHCSSSISADKIS